ncbi:hypothetical protein KsCSTR_29160 [Candidatus Kuenenia stuttgartiensis]|uniref:Uncharacterized protein n=2 Tax=Candidatus Brocadiaceae TaxID=1127830 RepID=Q1Q5T6_KUEST|nr:hypothetical protein KsCSTR_29160 [Candidatus Kuenenia stuttgartiensis]TVM01746.1 MAG: hypothetical protein CV080_03490 [Candidatus Kuenenia stuttgartiensis]CAJ75382.1 unknown protein [Candidatus Kuenenia stuttgartiensis]
MGCYELYFALVKIFLIFHSAKSLMTKIQTAKLLLILVSIAFCLSNATMGKIITHEHELHFEHGTVHVHHTTGDHGPGETDHKDAKDILSFDYLPANHSNSAKTIHAIKPCLFSRFSLQPDDLFICISSKNFHFLSFRQSSSSNKIYQLNSAYLI